MQTVGCLDEERVAAVSCGYMLATSLDCHLWSSVRPGRGSGEDAMRDHAFHYEQGSGADGLAGDAASAGRQRLGAQVRQAISTMEGVVPGLRGPSAPDANEGPTNVYYLAQYNCQLSLSAVTMADHEVGLLLPRSGRIWINTNLFSAVPRGRELVQRDAWWRVIDSSPAVRFLVAWCVSLYRAAQFDAVPRDQLPGWSRVMQFSPALPDCSRMRVQFWSDCVQQVTDLLVPSARVWRQMLPFAAIRPGDRHWQARLALAQHRVQDVVKYLADQNSCPSILVQRALDGNEPLSSYEEYQAFTEAVLEDLPRLRMQRVIAMQTVAPEASAEPLRPLLPAPLLPRLASLPSRIRGHWNAEIDDPRAAATFWSLHL